MIPAATSRLAFRHFRQEDFPQILQLNRDPKVMTYFPEMRSEDEIKMDFDRYLNYHLSHPGYGYWHTSLRHQNQFIGFFIVKVLPETGETEIGYRLLPQYWGQGLATEGAIAMVKYARDQLKVKRVVGVANPENQASRRVLEKAGLEFESTGRFYQVSCVYYSMEW